MKLFYSPAYCSLAVHIALREAGVPAEFIQVDTLATEWRATHPRGYVPVLELDDGSRHTEVAALLQYIADLAPERGLLPAIGSRDRFLALQWLTFVSSELHKTFSPWLFHQETADSTRKDCNDKIALRFTDLDTHLAGREWLVGERFTVADAYAFTIARWAPMLGMSLAKWPHLADYLERVQARPEVRAALRAEGLLKD